jgi:excinuclease ABC subunit B
VEILRQLRLGEFDVLVGINLLREGLDLPEVSLVVILDADKEGFLRDERSIIQTSGRAARHLSGEVILYADVVTRSIRNALKEIDRRRQKQLEYNAAHGIEPRSIQKSIDQVRLTTSVADSKPIEGMTNDEDRMTNEEEDKVAVLARLQREMEQAAALLEFEKAATLRDRIRQVRQQIDDDEWKSSRRKKLKGR